MQETGSQESTGHASAVAVVADGDSRVVTVGGAATRWRWQAGDRSGLRRAAVELVESGVASAPEVCSGFGVDRVTLWRWRRAHSSGGAEALRPRRSGPDPKLDPPTRQRVRAMRDRGLTLGAIAAELGVSASSVSRALRPSSGQGNGPSLPLTAVADGPPTGPFDRPPGPARPDPSPGRNRAFTNLPTPATSFVGREEELAWVTRLMGASRVVTVTGVAGVGKTRLALKAAALLARGYPDGVWWVQLASVSEPAAVAGMVAASIGLREQPGRGPVDSLVAQLRTWRALVVLDNCEHLLVACAEVVEAVLAACPEVSVLATSRELLGVSGEQVSALPPLDVPAPDGPGAPAEVSACESVRLFCERAGAAHPGFVLTPESAPAVGRICWSLEGIPLAIELAAARTAGSSPADIASSLHDRFHRRADPVTDGLARHRTMEAALAWSHDLLDDRERAVQRRLSVFVGGATTDAAVAVCGGDDVERGEVERILNALADKSLVLADASGPQPRWRLLEIIRRYGAERLADAGEDEAIRARHAHWCLGLAEEAEAHLTGADQQVWLERLNADHDNLRCAIEWATSDGHAEVGLRLGGALAMYWRARGHFGAGRQSLDAVLAAAGEAAPALQRAKAVWGWGFMTLMLGDYGGAEAAVASALALFEESGDTSGRARCFLLAGNCRAAVAGPQTVSFLAETSVALAREAGDTWCLAHALTILGWDRDHNGEADRGRALFDEAVAVARRAGDAQSLRIALAGLGSTAVWKGDHALAEVVLTEALSLVKDLGEDYETAMVNGYLADLALARGQHGRAAELVDAAMHLARRSGHQGAEVECLGMLGELALWVGDVESARSHLDGALTGARSLGLNCTGILRRLGEVAAADGDPATARALLADALEKARSANSAEAVSAALHALGELARVGGDTDGAASLHQEALELRLAMGRRPDVVASLEALGALSAAAGRSEQAARLLGAAHAARQAGGYARSPAAARAWDATVAMVVGALGPEEAETGLAEGAVLSPEEAASYALRGRRVVERPATGWDSLTGAERDVAALVGEALTNAEIAERLFMSLGTVKTHLSHIFSKLGVATRRELAREALRQAAR